MVLLLGRNDSEKQTQGKLSILHEISPKDMTFLRERRGAKTPVVIQASW